MLETAHEVLSEWRVSAGRWLFRFATLLLLAVAALQVTDALGVTTIGFSNWRPLLYTFVLWGLALGGSQILARGESGQQTVFILPALLFTLAMVIFPTFFGLYMAFTDWNLNAESGHHFNGLDNLVTLGLRQHFGNSLQRIIVENGSQGKKESKER